MIDQLTPAVTFRFILERVGLTSAPQPAGRAGRTFLGRWQKIFAALERWGSGSKLGWPNEVLLPERFSHFCRECGEDTPHEGFDEFGVGWYAAIYRCRYCGGEGMRVWPLTWW